jgi:hypothetical protein
MKYRTVCFVVPVDEQLENEALGWVRRELRFEHMLEAIHATATAVDLPPTRARRTSPVRAVAAAA